MNNHCACVIARTLMCSERNVMQKKTYADLLPLYHDDLYIVVATQKMSRVGANHNLFGPFTNIRDAERWIKANCDRFQPLDADDVILWHVRGMHAPTLPTGIMYVTSADAD